MDGCRKIKGLDGCFLKRPYGEQLLSAICRDRNDNMYPLAWAVVEVECRDSWSWFMTQLLDGLGNVIDSSWCFISDRQKVTHLFICVCTFLHL